MFVITSSNYSLEGHYRSSLIQLKNFYLVNISHLKPDQIEASIIGHGESLVSEHLIWVAGHGNWVSFPLPG